MKLLQRWKLEKRRLEDLKLRIQQRQNELIQSNKATIKLFEVEQANVNQVAFQQSLAGNVAAMKWFKPAVKRQEAAIAALESLYDLALSKKVLQVPESACECSHMHIFCACLYYPTLFRAHACY